MDALELLIRYRDRTAGPPDPALTTLDQASADGEAGGVRVSTRDGEPWIIVTVLDPTPDPETLHALKQEVLRHWGTLDLLDLLKHADAFPDCSPTVTSRRRPDFAGSTRHRVAHQR